MNDLFSGCGVEVTLIDSDSFLKIKETLTRIGVASVKNKTLYQSCNILHKRGRYVILHFKELFILDGKQADFSDNDIARRNTIAKLLADWGLVTIAETEELPLEPLAPISQIKILSYKEKNDWTLCQKYSIGTRK
jgi:hypothetical protein